MKVAKTPVEIADLIERFLSHRLLSSGEWYDFVDCSHPDPKVDSFRKQCGFFSEQLAADHKSLDLGGDDRWQDARTELRKIARQLRELDSHQ